MAASTTIHWRSRASPAVQTAMDLRKCIPLGGTSRVNAMMSVVRGAFIANGDVLLDGLSCGTLPLHCIACLNRCI